MHQLGPGSTSQFLPLPQEKRQVSRGQDLELREGVIWIRKLALELAGCSFVLMASPPPTSASGRSLLDSERTNAFTRTG